MGHVLSTTTPQATNNAPAAQSPQTTQGMDPRFLQFQNDIKKTANGIAFARALFTGKPMNEKLIRAAFQELGITIPKEIEMTIQLAQVVASGAALYEAYDTYQTIDDVRSVSSQTGATMRLGLKFSESMGWIKSTSQEAHMIRTAANICMIYASGGMDVSSWISLAMDFVINEATNQMNAQRLASEALAGHMRDFLTPQAKAASKWMRAYQEQSISIFEFVGRIAEAAPDLWPQYFPEMAAWAPVWTNRLTTYGESRTWYGTTASKSAEKTWLSIAGFTPAQLRHFVFQYMVEPNVYPFLLANKAFEGKGKASLMSMAVLSTMCDFKFIDAYTDYSPLFLGNQLSLSDFYMPQVLKYLDEVQDPRLLKSKATGITINGVQQLTKAQMEKANAEAFTFIYREDLKWAEYAGRPDILFRSPEVRKIMKDALSFPLIPPSEGQTAWTESRLVERSRGGENISQAITGYLGGPGAMWREVRNYFAALGLIDRIQKDSYFKDFQAEAFQASNGLIYGTRDLSDYDFMGSIAEFEAYHREVSMKSMIRKVNTMALGNVAYFLGTTPDKLVRVNRDEPNQPAIYDRRK